MQWHICHPRRLALNLKYLHHLITEVIDDFHGNTTRFGFVEWSGCVAVECRPGVGVDFGF